MIVAPGIHVLSTRKGGRVHATLVEALGGLVLVDTLFDDDGGIILDYMHAIGRQPTDIKQILLTHAHKSHVGGLAAIKAASGAPVLAHEAEIAIIEGRAKAKPVGFRMPRPWNWEVFGLQMALNAGIGRHTPVEVEGILREGHRIGQLEVIEVPGHTPGCLAFHLPQHHVLIAGDTVATWPAVDTGWPGFNIDHKQAQRSVAKMAELKPEVVTVGHGEPITSGATDVLRSLQP